jgi:hypothetical protein
MKSISSDNECIAVVYFSEIVQRRLILGALLLFFIIKRISFNVFAKQPPQGAVLQARTSVVEPGHGRLA